MGIQTGEGMEWETSVGRGKSADADAGGSRRGACVSSRTQYTYKHTHAYVYVRQGEEEQHTLFISMRWKCQCVCVCAVACGPSAYQQLHSLRLKRNFNGITTAANTFELTKSSAKASLTLSCDSALSHSLLSLCISVSLVLPSSPGLDDNFNSDCVLWSAIAIAIATRPTGVNSCQLFVDTHTQSHTYAYAHIKGPHAN